MTLTTYAGLVDVFIDGSATGPGQGLTDYYPANEVFTSLYKFLLSSESLSLGIERVAYNTGSGGSTSMNYWDIGGASGENAWAVFKFASASNPFYMLMQFAGNVDFGTTGGPAIAPNQNKGFGFAFAFKTDGTNPWGGTLNNNGTDAKGSTVWTGSLGSLCAFPMANSPGGEQTNRAGLTQLANSYQLNYDLGSGYRYDRRSMFHFLVSKDQFLATCDTGLLGNQNFVYFGKYDSLPDIAHPYPYCMIAWDMNSIGVTPAVSFMGTFVGGFVSDEAYYAFGSRRLVGSTNFGVYPQAYVAGGIVHPRTFQVGGLVYDYWKTMFHASGLGDGYAWHSVNTFMKPQGAYEVAKMPIGWVHKERVVDNFDPVPHTILGHITFFKLVNGLNTHTRLKGGKYVVVGTGLSSTLKFAIPWLPTYPGPMRNKTREGVRFITTQDI